MKTIACTFSIYNFCIPLKLTTFVCSNAIDSFGCSTSMETFWVHYYIWKYLPATIKLTTDRPTKGPTDLPTPWLIELLLQLKTYNSFLGAGVLSQNNYLFILLIQINKCYCLFLFFWRGEGVAVLSGKSLRFTHIA